MNENYYMNLFYFITQPMKIGAQLLNIFHWLNATYHKILDKIKKEKKKMLPCPPSFKKLNIFHKLETQF